MLKNVAGQRTLGVQMRSRSDGSDLDSGVTCFVCKDDEETWTAADTGGGGVLQNVSPGTWYYRPTQAETDGDVLRFQYRHASGLTAMEAYDTRAHSRVNTNLDAPVSGASTFDPAADKVDLKVNQSGVTIGTVNTCVSNDDMRGTDGAVTSLAGVAQETTSAAIKGKTDQLNFTGPDVHSVASNMRGTDGAQLAGPVDLNNDQSGVTIGTVGTVTNPVTAGTVTDKAGYSISGAKTTLDALNDIDAAAIEALLTAARNELGAAVPANGSIVQDLKWIAMRMRNEHDQDSNLQSVKNDAGTTIATATVGQASGTFTRGKFV